MSSTSHASSPSLCPICPDPNRHIALRQPLRDKLSSLSYAAYARCIERLLTALGYQEITTNGELRGSQRTPIGGYDMEAVVTGGLVRRRVLVQAKQYREVVPRCFVDELRGALVRRKADHGLLISTSGFSATAMLAAKDAWPVPVCLIDGEELLDLLLAHHIGIRCQGTASDAWELDAALFASLGILSANTETPLRSQQREKRARADEKPWAHSCAASDLTITLEFTPPKCEHSRRPRQ